MSCSTANSAVDSMEYWGLLATNLIISYTMEVFAAHSNLVGFKVWFVSVNCSIEAVYDRSHESWYLRASWTDTAIEKTQNTRALLDLELDSHKSIG